MALKVSRPLAVIDLETTDPEPTTCAIFDFAVTVLMPDGSRKRWQKTFKPWKPITPGAEEVTGVTNAMVENCPPFMQYADVIWRGLQGKDLAGYNIRSFDLPALDEELRRCRLKLALTGVNVIDAFSIFQKKEPRDLTAAVHLYCGSSHDGAHGAAADSEATLDVLIEQSKFYEDLDEMDVAELAAFSTRDHEPEDIAGKFYRDEDGDLRYTLAKVRDIKVKDDPGFAYWMLRQNTPPFPGSTVEVLRAELERHGL